MLPQQPTFKISSLTHSSGPPVSQPCPVAPPVLVPCLPGGLRERVVPESACQGAASCVPLPPSCHEAGRGLLQSSGTESRGRCLCASREHDAIVGPAGDVSPGLILSQAPVPPEEQATKQNLSCFSV